MQGDLLSSNSAITARGSRLFLISYLFLLYLLVHLELLSVIGFLPNVSAATLDSSGIRAIKLYQIALLVGGGIFFFRTKLWLRLIPAYYWGFISWAIIYSAFIHQVLDFDSNRILNRYFYSVLIVIVSASCTYLLSKRLVLAILRVATWILFVAVIIKAWVYRDAFIEFMQNPKGHPEIYTFYAGRVNVEATWLVLSSALFINRKYSFVVVWGLGLMFALLYATRTAVVIAIIMLMIHIWGQYDRKIHREALLLLGGTGLIFMLFWVDWSHVGDSFYGIRRLLSTGSQEDLGVQGRAFLWLSFLEMLEKTKGLWGVGVGNSILFIERMKGVDIFENDLNNMYFQVWGDLGVIGLILFLLMVWRVIVAFLRTRGQDPIATYLFLFFVPMGMVQMTGIEIHAQVILGIFFASTAGKT
jgi:hypothetical protein